MTIEAIGEFLTRFGMPLGALIIVLVTGHRRLWVFGWYAEELRQRVTRAEEQRDRAQGTTDRAIEVSRKVT